MPLSCCCSGHRLYETVSSLAPQSNLAILTALLANIVAQIAAPSHCQPAASTSFYSQSCSCPVRVANAGAQIAVPSHRQPAGGARSRQRGGRPLRRRSRRHRRPAQCQHRSHQGQGCWQHRKASGAPAAQAAAQAGQQRQGAGRVRAWKGVPGRRADGRCPSKCPRLSGRRPLPPAKTQHPDLAPAARHPHLPLTVSSFVFWCSSRFRFHGALIACVVSFMQYWSPCVLFVQSPPICLCCLVHSPLVCVCVFLNQPGSACPLRPFRLPSLTCRWLAGRLYTRLNRTIQLHCQLPIHAAPSHCTI